MPALIEVKETDKINWHFYMHQMLFKTGVILWENAHCVLEISIEKQENGQLSYSFKEDFKEV